jgi:putative component of membrane protein insertase Oxa1/YidC/SpoIIIJ protein YidD
MGSMIRALDPALGQLMVALIGGYQRFLSPCKGYACAHRVKFGGASCSEYGRQVFASEGWQAGLAKLKARFRECHAASRSLGAERLDSRVGDEFLDAPVGASEKPSSESEPAPATTGCPGGLATGCCCEAAANVGIETCIGSVCG